MTLWFIISTNIFFSLFTSSHILIIMSLNIFFDMNNMCPMHDVHIIEFWIFIFEMMFAVMPLLIFITINQWAGKNCVKISIQYFMCYSQSTNETCNMIHDLKLLYSCPITMSLFRKKKLFQYRIQIQFQTKNESNSYLVLWNPIWCSK